MPKPADYTPARRYLMQAIMTLILGGTIALAAGVASHVRRAHRVELSEDVVGNEDARVRLPVDWKARPVPNDPTVVVRAVEPGATRDEEGRSVTVSIERLPTPRSPMQHLLKQALGRSERDIEVANAPEFEPIEVAGRPGLMMTIERGGTRRRRVSTRKDILATAILPSQRAVVIHLQGQGQADAYDRNVVREIAANMTVAREPEFGRPGETVTLVDGIRFNTPAGFLPTPQADLNRVDRVLYSIVDKDPEDDEELERQWMTIEAVGCLCRDFDAADPKQLEQAKSTLATLLLVRDLGWRGANVTSLGDKVWRAEVPGERGVVADPRQAFLRTDPSGRALLVIFRGGYGAFDFERPWKELAASVTFLPSSDVASLEDVGTAEASRLRREGFDKLLADRDTAWWLMTERDRHIGWVNTDFTAGKLAGRTTSRGRSLGDDIVVSVTHDFYYKDDADRPHYEATVKRTAGSSRGTLTSDQTAKLADGQLALTWKQPSASDVRWSIGAPPQYVPGALLPLVIGRLSNDPMVLVTDALPGQQGVGPPAPITLVIRPAETSSTRPTAARCVTVQINGAGGISRWYFDATGDLQSIEWPSGVKQITSDERAVKAAFPRGDEMAP